LSTLFCFGLGYTALVLARRKRAEGWNVGGTVRSADKAEALRSERIDASVFGGSAPTLDATRALAKATHVLVSIPPGAYGDAALAIHGEDLARSGALRWLGYLSTIGVYGDRQGGWVDETAEPVREGRSMRRLEAEAAWLSLGERTGVPAHVFRLGGIYGPGRNALVSILDGSAMRIVKPGQVFNRIHVDDAAAVIEASMARPRQGGIYNVVDDEPAAREDLVVEAARLLGVDPPPAVSFEAAELSPMARAFYAANRRVRNDRIKEELGVRLAYPSYRTGLAALLDEARSGP
jgi:nucleoside-diphosphate-sugar epimerase